MSEHSINFLRAKLAEKTGKLARAKYLYSSPSVMESQDRAEALYRIGNISFQLGDLVDAQRSIESAIELDDTRGAWHYRLAFIFERNSDFVTACHEYRTALRLEPTNEKWAERLRHSENSLRILKAKSADSEAKSLRKSGARWQEIEVMRSASESFSSNPEWHVRLGDALAAMHRFYEAAQAYRRANELNPDVALSLFKEGRSLAQAGQPTLAAARFDEAIKSDKTLDARRLGVGIFHQELGDWPGAADAYSESCRASPDDPELYFRAGSANERCYRWHTAASYYQKATALEPFKASWHFRRGYIQERLQNWASAAECYAYGLKADSKGMHRYWHYRLGYVLAEAGDLLGAVEAYLNSSSDPDFTASKSSSVVPLEGYAKRLLRERHVLALDSQSYELNLQVAREFEEYGDWVHAAEHLETAADLSEKHIPAVYYRLGRAYYRSGDLASSAAALRMTKVVTKPRGIDPRKYAKDVGLNRLFEYTEMCENLPLRDNVIMYESFMGAKISCNPYALYLKIKSMPKFSSYHHVWTVTPDTFIPSEMKGLADTTFVTRGSHQYRRFLATSKYLINNVTFESYFVRRSGQKYLNTWHGTPLKTLGRDIKSGFLEHKNVTRNFLQTTHMISPNRHTTQVLTDRYDVGLLMTGTIAETGYPRVDRTLGLTSEKRISILSQLGVPDGKRLVLYAPTWRGDLYSGHFDIDKLVSDLKVLASLDCRVVFQAHHHTERLLPTDLGVTVVPKSIDTNDLLAVVDVLITDYSSILFDFIPTGRPVFCYVYDLDEYSAERGLYFTPSSLGLPEIKDIRELETEVRDSLSGGRSGVISPQTTDFSALEDGGSADRVIAYLFDDSTADVVEVASRNKRRVLFHHSFLPNGITASLVNLITSLDPNIYDITVAVPVGDIEKDPVRQAKLRELPESVHIVGQFGRQVVNIEEKWVIDFFNRHQRFSSDGQEDVYNHAFKREYNRIFGGAVFDSVIEFEGYSRYWTSLLSSAPGSDTRKLVYLHNDMYEEWRSKYQYLEAMFRLYTRFDAYVSVSPALRDENRQKLASLFALDDSRFVDAINQIDSAKVIEMSKDNLDADLRPWFEGERPALLSMGRMSPEKDQMKLLRAVAILRSKGVDTRLVIFGAGPLESVLRAAIDELGLSGHVYLAGQRTNPFPALSKCSAFVLASNHEGQPMVLLEALVLGAPVIATDITGSRFVLEGTEGRLVENSVEGLVDGLNNFIIGDESVSMVPFDADLYMKQASAAFTTLTGEPDLRRHVVG